MMLLKDIYMTLLAGLYKVKNGGEGSLTTLNRSDPPVKLRPVWFFITVLFYHLQNRINNKVLYISESETVLLRISHPFLFAA